MLATGQQVGGALGVAVLSAVFYGALGGGVAAAYRVALVALVGLALVTVALVQLLPVTRTDPPAPR